MPKLSDDEKAAILDSILEALPESAKDSHTARHNSRNASANQWTTLYLNESWTSGHLSVSLRFRYPASANGKAWPVRKDKTVNVKAIASRITSVTESTKKRLALEAEGASRAEQRAKELSEDLREDPIIQELGLDVQIVPTSRSLDGTCRVEIGRKHKKRKWLSHTDMEADVSDSGWSIRLRESRLRKDQVLGILKILKA